MQAKAINERTTTFGFFILILCKRNTYLKFWKKKIKINQDLVFLESCENHPDSAYCHKHINNV